VDAQSIVKSRASKSRPKRGRVRCHRDGCRAAGVVVVEAPCCGKSVLVCVNCAWEAMLEPSAELEVVA
jgi:hypothetical protein